MNLIGNKLFLFNVIQWQTTYFIKLRVGNSNWSISEQPYKHDLWYSGLLLCIFWPIVVHFLAYCCAFLAYCCAFVLAYCCAFSGLLCIFWPIVVHFLAYCCAFSGLLLCIFWPIVVHFWPIVVHFLVYCCAFLTYCCAFLAYCCAFPRTWKMF